MSKTVVDYLESSACQFPRKVAYTDESQSLLFQDLRNTVLCMAQELIHRNIKKSPIAICLENKIECIVALWGIAYSGNFYVILDADMPLERTKKILDVLQPKAIVADARYKNNMLTLYGSTEMIQYQHIQKNCADETFILKIANSILDSDILCVTFTSGSTGIPKGVMTSHRAMRNEIDTLVKAMAFQSEDIFANQLPLCFMASIVDVFGALKVGATVHIIPHKLLYSPQNLLSFVSEKKITIFAWAPSLLRLIADYNVLGMVKLHKVRKIMFMGEPIQMSALKKWIEALPQTTFVNIYGTTEMTMGGFYYIVKKPLLESEPLPIGLPFEHTEAFILDEHNKEVNKGEIGELCIKTSTLSSGYFGDTQNDHSSFIKNSPNYLDRKVNTNAEVLYRTGDLVFQNTCGDFVYVGRKDLQIKRHGYRVEPAEIEFCVAAIKDVTECCCVYEHDFQKLVLFFCGQLDEITLLNEIRNSLPKYMIPDCLIKLDRLLRNQNGKINRKEMGKQVYKYL